MLPSTKDENGLRGTSSGLCLDSDRGTDQDFYGEFTTWAHSTTDGGSSESTQSRTHVDRPRTDGRPHPPETKRIDTRRHSVSSFSDPTFKRALILYTHLLKVLGTSGVH